MRVALLAKRAANAALARIESGAPVPWVRLALAALLLVVVLLVWRTHTAEERARK